VHREMTLRVEQPAPPSRALKSRLRVVHPGSDPNLRPGGVITLQADNILGSAPDNDLVFADRFVSRRHARLYWDGAAWWLEDLGSRNGTYVNRQAITPHQPQRLERGAVISLGDMTFELVE